MAELTTMVLLGDREIEMRKPTEASLVVLARVSRGIPKIENVEELTDQQRDRLISGLGTVGRIIESMIVHEEDAAWLDDAMIDGAVTAAEALEAIRKAGENFNTGSGPVKATKAVRRAR